MSGDILDVAGLMLLLRESKEELADERAKVVDLEKQVAALHAVAVAAKDVFDEHVEDEPVMGRVLDGLGAALGFNRGAYQLDVVDCTAAVAARYVDVDSAREVVDIVCGPAAAAEFADVLGARLASQGAR